MTSVRRPTSIYYTGPPGYRSKISTLLRLAGNVSIVVCLYNVFPNTNTRMHTHNTHGAHNRRRFRRTCENVNTRTEFYTLCAIVVWNQRCIDNSKSHVYVCESTLYQKYWYEITQKV